MTHLPVEHQRAARAARIGLAALLALALLASACASRPTVRFRAVYLDMDGTLLDETHAVRPEVAAALAEYRACGGRVGLASGRLPEQVRPHLAVVQPDLPLLLGNGALVLAPDGETLLRAETLPPAAARRALLAGRGMEGVRGAFVQSADRTLVDRPDEELAAVAAGAGVTLHGVCDPERDCVPAPESGAAPPIKVLFFVHPGHGDALAAALQTALAGEAAAFVTSPRTVEVVAPDVNKGSALRRVLAEQGLTLADVVAFGDSSNDVQMLGVVPVSVAMRGCQPETCDAALFRTHGHDTDAIAWVLRLVVMPPECVPPDRRGRPAP